MPKRDRRRFVSNEQRPRDPLPRDPFQQVVVVGAGVVFYVVLVWFGVRVVGDTMARSLLIAGLIVIIAGVGYWFTHQESPPRR